MSSEKKLSKLALLAKERAQARSSLPQPVLEDSGATTAQKRTSKLSALAKTRKSQSGTGIEALRPSEDAGAQPDKPKLVKKTNLASLALRKRPRPETDEGTKDHDHIQGQVGKGRGTETESDNSPSTQSKDDDASQVLLDQLHPAKVALLDLPRLVVSLFLLRDACAKSVEHQKKRRRCAVDVFCAYTNNDSAAKAKSNFSLPSPDDRVFEAQKQAFEKDMNKLSIKEQPKEKKAALPAPTKPFKSIDLSKELSKNPAFTKPNVSFVIIGHVDAGKSTLIGRLLYDVGAVDAKTVNKLVREAEKMGKGSFALAWVMDQTSEERSRGVTVDICATNFETKDTRFTAIDAPGHKDFVPQMIGGVSQADAALLVVDAINGEFEAGFVMDGQTKEHTLLAKNLGIDKVCVAVNKMDKENWSQERFEDIKEQLLQYLTSEGVGFKAENVSFVPISGLTGTNVVKSDTKTSELAWYKGPTLLESLDAIKTAEGLDLSPQELLKEDFNFSINDIYDVTSSEFKIKGKITSGYIQPGQSVVIHPTEDFVQVQGVFLNDAPADVAISGQICLLKIKIAQLKNKQVEDLSIGDILLNVESSVKSVKVFDASVNLFNMTKPLLVGTPFVLFRNNAPVSARISKVHLINGAKKKKMHLVSKQVADVEIEVLGDRALPVAVFKENKWLGRIVIRREGSTVGAGVITEISKADK